MKLAAAAYPLDWFDDFAAYAAKITTWTQAAKARGADLLVYPEYGAMELASLGGAATAADLDAALHEVARHRAAVDALLVGLARDLGLHILGASGPARGAGGRWVNRATFYAPHGILGHQDKQIMTRFEREDWGVHPGGPLVLFDTALGRIGVAICYDSEFPLLARRLAEAGAEILLVPSCTDSPAGFTRVRVGAMARALENQCVVVQAPTVGPCDWCPAVDINHGRAAIYGPPDRGWPETGIIAETDMDAPGWAIADVSLDAIAETRRDGAVLNLRHWAEQQACVESVEIVRSPGVSRA